MITYNKQLIEKMDIFGELIGAEPTPIRLKTFQLDVLTRFDKFIDAIRAGGGGGSGTPGKDGTNILLLNSNINTEFPSYTLNAFNLPPKIGDFCISNNGYLGQVTVVETNRATVQRKYSLVGAPGKDATRISQVKFFDLPADFNTDGYSLNTNDGCIYRFAYKNTSVVGNLTLIPLDFTNSQEIIAVIDNTASVDLNLTFGGYYNLFMNIDTLPVVVPAGKMVEVSFMKLDDVFIRIVVNIQR